MLRSALNNDHNLSTHTTQTQKEAAMYGRTETRGHASLLHLAVINACLNGISCRSIGKASFQHCNFAKVAIVFCQGPVIGAVLLCEGMCLLAFASCAACRVMFEVCDLIHHAAMTST